MLACDLRSIVWWRIANMQTSATDPNQYTEGQGKQPEHTHAARTHTHDHYHISHHRSDNPLNPWEHREYWHTHQHNHNLLVHSHDHSQQQEEAEHGKESHVHDHAAPAQSPA